ncbi:MAG: tetratricopeptide (TPR) repeat protein [Candidatus Azotimanducaceae bacterium]|jgi:tetratricopeptide (TPR) repeat protein
MKYLVIASLLMFAPLLVEVSTGLDMKSSATAAERRKVPPMKERTYKIISEAQILIDPDSIPVEEGEEKPDVVANPPKAIEMLKEALTRRGLNGYEVAQIWNTLAFAYYTIDDLPGTKMAYEKVLAQDKISLALELSSTRALFQLYYADENYAKSIEFIDKWMVLNEKPDTDITFIKATAYYQMERLDDALTTAIRLEAIAAELGKEMKENWLYIQVVLYNEKKDYDKVIELLERMIVSFPKKQYWMHLAGMYGEKEWDDKALSAYYAAYTQGMFEKETEVIMLSQRLLNAEVPFEATAILEKGFKDELIEKNEKNIRLLATAYTMSKDFDNAIKAWKEASVYAKDGEIFYRLAQALSNEDRHKEAVVAYRDALEQEDGLKDIEEVQFWLGISLLQLEDWDDAQKAFRLAAKDKDRRKSANQYIQYIANERKRQAALKEMLSAS